MKGALLRFTELDVEMIHDSLAARAARSGAGALSLAFVVVRFY
jgi:hypothetical protein